jgi:hypothetical protein
MKAKMTGNCLRKIHASIKKYEETFFLFGFFSFKSPTSHIPFSFLHCHFHSFVFPHSIHHVPRQSPCPLLYFSLGYLVLFFLFLRLELFLTEVPSLFLIISPSLLSFPSFLPHLLPFLLSSVFLLPTSTRLHLHKSFRLLDFTTFVSSITSFFLIHDHLFVNSMHFSFNLSIFLLYLFILLFQFLHFSPILFLFPPLTLKSSHTSRFRPCIISLISYHLNYYFQFVITLIPFFRGFS